MVATAVPDQESSLTLMRGDKCHVECKGSAWIAPGSDAVSPFNPSAVLEELLPLLLGLKGASLPPLPPPPEPLCSRVLRVDAGPLSVAAAAAAVVEGEDEEEEDAAMVAAIAAPDAAECDG
jgi:hypothetical protein